MLFAFVADYKPGASEEQQDKALARRAGWKWPEGATSVAEFWAIGGGSPLVYSVFEATDATAVWRLFADWTDVFDVAVIPVVTAEQGLAAGASVLGSRTR